MAFDAIANASENSLWFTVNFIIQSPFIGEFYICIIHKKKNSVLPNFFVEKLWQGTL